MRIMEFLMGLYLFGFVGSYVFSYFASMAYWTNRYSGWDHSKEDKVFSLLWGLLVASVFPLGVPIAYFACWERLKYGLTWEAKK